MKKYLKMVKIGDIVIVLLLLALSFVPLGIFTYQSIQAGSGVLYARILVDGEEIKIISLEDDGESEIFEYEDEQGNLNIVYREGNTVRMHEASCKDQLCVCKGVIGRVGETIVCLPNRFVVEVMSDSSDTSPDFDVDVLT